MINQWEKRRSRYRDAIFRAEPPMFAARSTSDYRVSMRKRKRTEWSCAQWRDLSLSLSLKCFRVRFLLSTFARVTFTFEYSSRCS